MHAMLGDYAKSELRKAPMQHTWASATFPNNTHSNHTHTRIQTHYPLRDGKQEAVGPDTTQSITTVGDTAGEGTNGLHVGTDIG